MKKAVLMLSVITGAVMVAFLACNTEVKKEGETVISNDSLVKRGDEMIIAMPMVANSTDGETNSADNATLPSLNSPEKSSSPSQLPIWQQWVDLFVPSAP